MLSPKFLERGGCASKKMPRSDRSGADGVVDLATIVLEGPHEVAPQWNLQRPIEKRIPERAA